MPALPITKHLPFSTWQLWTPQPLQGAWPPLGQKRYQATSEVANWLVEWLAEWLAEWLMSGWLNG